MALPQHDAAAHHQRRRGEAELLGPQHGCNHGIPSCLQLTVGLHYNTAPQSVGHQHLLGLGDAQFPRQAGVLDGRLGRRAGASIVPADQDNVPMPLGNAGRNGADADFSHQLDVDARIGVDVLKVVNQLG